MKVTKYTNYILIEGLEEHYQAYDENSFRIEKLDRSSVLFLLEIVSPFSVKLNFLENVTDEMLIVAIDIDKLKTITTTVEIKKEEPQVPDEDEELEYNFKDGYLNIYNQGILYHKDLKIVMEKYELERYDDFFDDKIYVDIPVNEFGEISKKIPLEMELDYIYRIFINFKGNKKTIEYIHEKPTLYYSSIYHLKQIAKNYDLYIKDTNKSEFDMKLLIWKYSKIAVGIAGISGDIIYKQNNSILNDYVCQRALLEMVTSAIKDLNLTPDLAQDSLGAISVTLADLTHGAATTETMTTQLIKVHKQLLEQLESAEEKLKSVFSYLQAQDSIDKQCVGRPVIRTDNFNPRLRRRRLF